ncbi:hypothetical protein P3T73_12415 [Kiritimatiellota bacterium B12222]|nr:hypothetical protein P3T73_12415 [Kiritimatiellota bacterium B12222]
MKKIIQGSNLRAYFVNLTFILFLWILNIALNNDHAESWGENFKYFPYLTLHVELSMLGFLAVLLLMRICNLKFRIKITDEIIVGPKGYAPWNEGKVSVIKRGEKFEVKYGILGGWIFSARITQGKQKIKFDPDFFSKKKIDTIIQTIHQDLDRSD